MIYLCFLLFRQHQHQQTFWSFVNRKGNIEQMDMKDIEKLENAQKSLHTKNGKAHYIKVLCHSGSGASKMGLHSPRCIRRHSFTFSALVCESWGPFPLCCAQLHWLHWDEMKTRKKHFNSHEYKSESEQVFVQKFRHAQASSVNALHPCSKHY